MTRPTLLLLAGTSGAGKTSLLQAALAQSQPVFGEAADAGFQALRPPSRLPESLLSFEQTLHERTWFQAIHLPALSALAALPEVVVLHVDLSNVLTLLRERPDLLGAPPCPLAPGRPWTRAELLDPARLTQCLARFVALPFFQRFERVVVHTLQPDWAHNRQQWRQREHTPPPVAAPAPTVVHRLWRSALHWRRQRTGAVAPLLFDGTAAAQTAHTNIYQAWRAVLPALRPVLNIHSHWRHGHLWMQLDRPDHPGAPVTMQLPLRAPEAVA